MEQGRVEVSADPAAPEGSVADEVGEPTQSAASEEPTGVAAVDAALERLGDLADAPIEAHVEIFDDVQRQLHEALAELDE